MLGIESANLEIPTTSSHHQSRTNYVASFVSDIMTTRMSRESHGKLSTFQTEPLATDVPMLLSDWTSTGEWFFHE